MKFDPALETARYIDGLGSEALERAASYTSGSHWLLLGGFIFSLLATWIIVRFKMIERSSIKLGQRGWVLRAFIQCASYFAIFAAISLPWTVFQSWGFEKAFGRTNQPLTDFLVQHAIETSISCITGGIFFVAVYALIRKTGKSWWLWSGGLAAFAVSAIILISPILFDPIFNEYKPVPDGPVRTALMRMADEAAISHDRILMFDGSRQSNNFTANVSGILGTGRIAISDVAIDSASLDEVMAVTGHEIGHYVLGHVWRFVFLVVPLAMLGFFLANKAFYCVAAAMGSKARVGDPEGLPILLLIVSTLALLAQPVMNWVTRLGESEADAYSLRTVNKPSGLAGALIKTAEHRDPRPSAIQELIFYAHPSIERRVRAAMDWQAEQLKRQAASE